MPTQTRWSKALGKPRANNAVVTKQVVIKSPIWQPDKSKAAFQLACPQCDDTHVRVYRAAVEIASDNRFDGPKFGSSAGEVTLYCNGHADSQCSHHFIVVIKFHDGGVQCLVEPDRSKLGGGNVQVREH